MFTSYKKGCFSFLLVSVSLLNDKGDKVDFLREQPFI